MEKKIAIRGHKTRWKDVIKALEDMGGENRAGWEGYDQMGAYYINDKGNIVWGSLEHPTENGSYSLYTLEEYEALQLNLKGLGEDTTDIWMKYKVGDKVRIKSLDWYNENKDDNREIKFENGIFTTLKSTFLGQIMTIEEITLEKQYILMEDRYKTLWTDEMIEGLVEEEVGLVDNLSSRWVNEFNLPDGYIFKDENGNVINATKIVLEKKKKEYPKTYKECCEIVKVEKKHTLEGEIIRKNNYKIDLLESFQKLLICRDAYWTLYGEEKGLGKPWEPDYDSGVNKYGIICMNGVVQESNPTTNWERHLNKVLDFPTAEMRDAFYENFKEEIEQYKELL